jgi:hypothetical protein
MTNLSDLPQSITLIDAITPLGYPRSLIVLAACMGGGAVGVHAFVITFGSTVESRSKYFSTQPSTIPIDALRGVVHDAATTWAESEVDQQLLANHQHRMEAGGLGGVDWPRTPNFRPASPSSLLRLWLNGRGSTLFAKMKKESQCEDLRGYISILEALPTLVINEQDYPSTT